jgi:hypothetical protein
MSLPGSPGMPAASGGTQDDPKDASKIKEFPVVDPTASEVERVGPDPPESPGFFQM